MISSQELQGKWTSIRGKVKEKWGQLTDDDLMIAGGNVDQMVGKIQQRTGETRQAIESFVNDLLKGGSQAAQSVGEKVQGMYEQSRDAVQHVGEQVGRQARDGLRRAEHMVQEYPATSVASVFVGGVLTGLAIGLLLVGDRR